MPRIPPLLTPSDPLRELPTMPQGKPQSYRQLLPYAHKVPHPPMPNKQSPTSHSLNVPHPHYKQSQIAATELQQWHGMNNFSNQRYGHLDGCIISFVPRTMALDNNQPPTAGNYKMFLPDSPKPRCATYIRNNLGRKGRKIKDNNEGILSIFITINNSTIELINVYAPNGREGTNVLAQHTLNQIPVYTETSTATTQCGTERKPETTSSQSKTANGTPRL